METSDQVNYVCLNVFFYLYTLNIVRLFPLFWNLMNIFCGSFHVYYSWHYVSTFNLET